MSLNKKYSPSTKHLMVYQWDIIVFTIIFGTIAALVWGAQQMNAPYELGERIAISIDPSFLPSYAISTVLRMGIALLFSVLFTLIVGSLAAKNKRAEQIILPFIDIMQSIPVLGFLSITVSGFVMLFHGSQLGPECAAIFAIFTSQVWNMTLSFYQSLKTVPKDLIEVSRMYHLGAWQKFWLLEVPFAIPGLLWNMMMSMSAGWFFVVASEAISVSNHTINLPGIGSYIYVAIEQSNSEAIWFAILAMFVVIMIYDQILFRPLVAWSSKFKTEEETDNNEPESWFLTLLQRARFVRLFKPVWSHFKDTLISPRWIKKRQHHHLFSPKVQKALSATAIAIWNTVLVGSIVTSTYFLVTFIATEISIGEVVHVIYLGFITALKVFALIILCSFIWVPIGVWVGLRPKAAAWVQPIAQFLAAFPVNLIYPLIVILIVKYDLNVNIWTTPLMILGTQWYIVFNVIAGTTTIPMEMKLAVENYGVRGILWWKRFMLPAIFPYYVTGAMTAAGGCWNASILAEVVTWGNTTLTATGLGGYIKECTTLGDFPRIALGIGIMSLYVIVINRLVWRRLYESAQSRYNLG